MKVKEFITVLGLVLLACETPTLPGPLEGSVTAFDGKDYATALKLLQSLVDQVMLLPKFILVTCISAVRVWSKIMLKH